MLHAQFQFAFPFNGIPNKIIRGYRRLITDEETNVIGPTRLR